MEIRLGSPEHVSSSCPQWHRAERDFMACLSTSLDLASVLRRELDRVREEIPQALLETVRAPLVIPWPDPARCAGGSASPLPRAPRRRDQEEAERHEGEPQHES